MVGIAPHSHDALRYPLVSRQPLRFLYSLARKVWLIARVPFWIAYLAIFPCPHPKWTLSTTLASWMGKEEGETFAGIGITEELSLDPGEDDFEVINPGPPGLYVDPLDHPVVRPAPIGMTRYHRQPPSAPPDGAKPQPGLVVLHLHGGAFVWGSGRAKQMAFLVDTLLTESNGTIGTIFAPQYRLASYGAAAQNSPFPAALQDSVTAYHHLVTTLGIPASRIVIAGDSAGGNLAIALIRYIEAFFSSPEFSLPRPLAAVLVSPWVAPTLSLGPVAAARANFTGNPHWATDWMPFGLCRWGARVYTAGVPAEHPYITALGNPFSTRVPVLLVLGEAEILEVEGTEWVREMCGVAGNCVKVLYEEAAPHDTLLLGGGTVWADSARGVARGIGRWLAGARDVAADLSSLQGVA